MRWPASLTAQAFPEAHTEMLTLPGDKSCYMSLKPLLRQGESPSGIFQSLFIACRWFNFVDGQHRAGEPHTRMRHLL